MKRLARVAFGLALCVSTFTSIGCGSASPTSPSTGGIPSMSVTPGAQILIDASKDGGVWWFPQSGTFDANATHQGRALADLLRRHGYTVDELPRGAAVTSTLLANYRLVIRVGSCTAYPSSELAAYDSFVANPTAAVWLLTDHMNGGCNKSDPLAGRYGGITYTGSTIGTITEFAPHEITAGVTQLYYNAGATVVSFDANKVDILATIGTGKSGAMGVIRGYGAKIFFLGDSNCVQSIPQPLMDNLIAWSFSLD